MNDGLLIRTANEADPQCITADRRDEEWAVLVWLPILFGFSSSFIAALLLCPVPRTQTVTPTKAFFLAASYVLLTVGIGSVILVACGALAARQELTKPLRQLPRFYATAAWIPPIIAFYRRDSWWATLAVVVFAVLCSALVYRHNLGTTEEAARLSTDSQSSRVMWLTIAALLLQLAVLFAMASMAGAAAIVIGGARRPQADSLQNHRLQPDDDGGPPELRLAG